MEVKHLADFGLDLAGIDQATNIAELFPVFLNGIMRSAHAEFAAGSMLPKVQAACEFAGATGKPAVIGALADIDAMLAGTAGTRVAPGVPGVTFDHSYAK